jgi:hypothetical protein
LSVKKRKAAKAAKKVAMTKSNPVAKDSISKPDFQLVFDQLKKVMAAFASDLHVAADEPKKYYLVTKSKS